MGIPDISTLNFLFHFLPVSQVQSARKQLTDILVHAGFPPDIFLTKQMYQPYELDAVVGTLVAAFYPNTCLHKETRRILTNEDEIVLIHKSSVLYSYIQANHLNKSTSLKSPLFVYTEKSANRNLISAKHMTMVSFMQLLLFGVRRYEFRRHSDTIKLDGWLEIRIDPQVFDCVWVIKTELENILTRVCYQPQTLGTLSQIETGLLETVKHMVCMENVDVAIKVNKARPALMPNV